MLEAPRRAKSPAGAHLRWPSTFALTFTGLGFSRTLIVLPSSYLFLGTCLDQAGARFGLGLARGFLCLLRLSLAWRPSSLEPSGPVQMDGFGFGFGFGSRPVFFRQPGWMPPIMNKWTGGCMDWAGFGSKLLVLIEIEPVSVREAIAGH